MDSEAIVISLVFAMILALIGGLAVVDMNNSHEYRMEAIKKCQIVEANW